MDLRIVKTKRAIKDAFFELRKTTPLEKLWVRDICKKALINKSTFYNHYSDVFILSDELENEILVERFEKFEYKDCLFSDPQTFMEEIPKAIDQNYEPIQILFRGRMEVLYQKLQRQLYDYYKDPNASPEYDILLTFIIGGAMQAMQEISSVKKYSVDLTVSCLSDCIRKLSPVEK